MESDKKYEVIVSREAEETLIRHIEFLARVSISAAEDMLSEFNKAVKSLSTMPERCALYEYQDDTDETIRKLIFYKRYEIVFRLSGKTVYLDVVHDCRQDNEKTHNNQ